MPSKADTPGAEKRGKNNSKNEGVKQTKQHELDKLLEGNVRRDSRAAPPPARVEHQAPDGGTRDESARLIDHELIDPNPFNPRRFFGPKELRDLADSMLDNGQLQNLTVRPRPGHAGRYQIAAGERRWRAAGLPQAKYNKLKKLRCVVRDLDDYETAQASMEENERRVDVTAVARARGLKHLYDLTPGVAGKPATWEQVAARAKLEPESAMRLVRLLQLPDAIQLKMEELGLNEKHGRALLRLEDDRRAQNKLLREIEDQELSGSEALRRAEAVKPPESRSTRPSCGDNASGRTSGPDASAPPDDSHASGTNGEVRAELEKLGVAGRFSNSDAASTTSASTTIASTIASAAEGMKTDLAESRARIARVAQQLSHGSATVQLRKELRKEVELIQENLDRVRGEVS